MEIRICRACTEYRYISPNGWITRTTSTGDVESVWMSHGHLEVRADHDGGYYLRISYLYGSHLLAKIEGLHEHSTSPAREMAYTFFRNRNGTGTPVRLDLNQISDGEMQEMYAELAALVGPVFRAYPEEDDKLLSDLYLDPRLVMIFMDLEAVLSLTLRMVR